MSLTRSQIEAERRRFRALFEDVEGSCAVTDRFGTIVDANDALGALLNTEPTALRGRRLVNYVAGGSGRRAFYLALARVRASVAIDEVRLDVRPRKKRPTVAVVVSAVAKRDAAGDIVAARWLIRPV